MFWFKIVIWIPFGVHKPNSYLLIKTSSGDDPIRLFTLRVHFGFWEKFCCVNITRMEELVSEEAFIVLSIIKPVVKRII